MSFRDLSDVVEESANGPEEPAWYLAYTRPRMEETALINLQRQGFHTYLPMFKTLRRTEDGLQPTHVAMFPRYVFLRPATARQSLSPVASTRGVCSLVRFGVDPAIVLPEIIRHIREFEVARNRAGLDAISPIQPGTRVRMRKGALKGLEGLVVSVAKQRVTFLLEILGREKPVTVAHDELESA
jgi:transcriptional antiterminator RfaH